MYFQTMYLLAGMILVVSVIPSMSVEPITQLEVSIGLPILSDCTLIKSFTGFSYSQMVVKNPPDISKVSYILHTAGTGNTTVKKSFKLASPISELTSNPSFVKEKGLTIIIHGYIGSQESLVITEGTSALLKRGGVNVFSLDTQALLNETYLKSSTHAQFIGVALGKSLSEYIKAGNSASKIHLIGHSLGAHIEGFAGKTVTSLTGFKIGRISGLDPAGPCYEIDSPGRLDDTDADFVDVIHSDAGFKGIVKPIGHADFYPNGGRFQPNVQLGDIYENHRRAWRYFIESILYPKNFLSSLCSLWQFFNSNLCSNTPRVYMGYDTPSATRGIYFLRTAGYSLYGLGDNGAAPAITVG